MVKRAERRQNKFRLDVREKSWVTLKLRTKKNTVSSLQTTTTARCQRASIHIHKQFRLSCLPNCEELRCFPSPPAPAVVCLSPLRCRTVSDNVRCNKCGLDFTSDGRRTGISSRFGRAADGIDVLCFGDELQSDCQHSTRCDSNTSDYVIKKVTTTMLHKRAQVGTHLPLQGLEPVGGEPLMSVTRGQCNADLRLPSQPQGINYRPLAGTKLCCLVTQT